MSIPQNGDFSDGLNGWTVSSPAGPTAPTHDPINNRVIFGRADNDVQNGDTLEQAVALTAGTEYTLSFVLAEIGTSPFAGFGVTIELIRLSPDGNVTSDTQALGSFQVGLDEVNNVTTTFVSNFDNALFRVRGQFGFGTMESFLIIDDIVLTCFTAGTVIDTPSGPRAIEDIVRGDLVNTLDDGPCPVRWIGSRDVSAAEMSVRPDWWPIVINADALATGVPIADAALSPAHRVLIRGQRVELLFGESVVLVAAKSLIDAFPGVACAQDKTPVTYYHLLFDKHQLVMANGLVSESFRPALRAVTGSDRETRREILSIFPNITQTGECAFSSVRPQLKAYECRVLFSQDTRRFETRLAS